MLRAKETPGRGREMIPEYYQQMLRDTNEAVRYTAPPFPGIGCPIGRQIIDNLVGQVRKLIAEIGWAGSPPPGGSWMQRLELSERLQREMRETLDAYKEATEIVSKVDYVDGLNRALRKEAEEAARLRLRVQELEATLEEFDPNDPQGFLQLMMEKVKRR